MQFILIYLKNKKMKTLFTMTIVLLFSTTITTAQPGGNKNGYSRTGSQETMKEMKNLFTESFLFSKGVLNVSGEKGENKPAILEAIANSDATIKEFEKKVEEFLKTKPAANILKSDYHKVTSKANGLSKAIENADDGLKNWRSLTAVSFLQDLYLYKAYLTAAVKVYPEAISLQEKLEEAEAAIKRMPSREDYIAKMEKNKVDYLKSLRMKNAVISDAKIEAAAKKEYENSWKDDKVTVTKVHITTNWTIEKNALDIPVSKEVEVNFAIKKGDGTCAFATGRMYSVYEGGGKYGAAYLIMPSPPITIPCENLPKQ